MISLSPNPYSKIRIAFSYLSYYLKAKRRHGVHSPFAYSFVEEVILKARYINYPKIEQQRREFRKSNKVLNFTDYGKSGNTFKKKVSTIAKNSLKSPKYAKLLSSAIAYYKPKNVLELGTSLGITTAYMAKSANNITTMEGDASVVAQANQGWDNLDISNIKTIIGNFDETLSQLDNQKFDLIYIDGNHKYEPTIRYFDNLLDNAFATTLFIFDDIHYSEDMEKAWEHVKNQPNVKVTIDLFFLGFVSLDPTLTKQNHSLRY